jgi:hypothetical protein
MAVVYEKLSGKQGLSIYNLPSALGKQSDPPIATDRHFGHTGMGNRIVAMTCADTDGDGVDEIAIIRQRSGGKQRLEIYESPHGVGGYTGEPIASDPSFGNLNSDKNNIAIAGLDMDGDGTNEIAVLREKQSGRQGLFIFNAPQSPGGDTGPPIATDRSFGFSSTGKNIIAMTGLDINGDGTDEIAVIMQRASGQQRLEIYNCPQSLGGETGDPIARDLTFGHSNSNRDNIALTSVDIDDDGIDEIAVVRQRPGGGQRLEIYNAPQGVDGETGPAVASDLTFGTAGTDNSTKFVSGISF